MQKSPFELLRSHRVIPDFGRVLQLLPPHSHLFVQVLLSQIRYIKGIVPHVAPRVGSHVTQGDSPPPKALFNSGVKGKPKSASKASTEMHTPGATLASTGDGGLEDAPKELASGSSGLVPPNPGEGTTLTLLEEFEEVIPTFLEHLCSTDPITELAHLIGPTSKFPCSVGSIPEHLCSSSPVTELARSISPTYEFPYSIGSVPEHLCSANPIIELARSISSTSEFPCSAGPVPEHLCSASPITELARLISLTSEFPCSAGSVPKHLCLASPVTKLARSISLIFEFPCSAGSVPEHLFSVSPVTKLACSISPIFEFPCSAGSVPEHLFSLPRQDELDSIVNPLPNARPHHQRPNRVPREGLSRGEGNDIANISLAVTSPPPRTTRSLAWPT
ncbi:hypothetical protein BHM03_00044999 [Ensete ventricosum]|nr:hypothetical protein BHM03_00044999 [Ensete ventricosum]